MNEVSHKVSLLCMVVGHRRRWDRVISTIHISTLSLNHVISLTHVVLGFLRAKGRVIVRSRLIDVLHFEIIKQWPNLGILYCTTAYE